MKYTIMARIMSLTLPTTMFEILKSFALSHFFLSNSYRPTLLASEAISWPADGGEVRLHVGSLEKVFYLPAVGATGRLMFAVWRHN